MRPEARVPGTEGLFQGGIQYMHTHGKKRLNGEVVRAHLLFLDHSFFDDFVDCGLDSSGGNRLIGTETLAVIRQ
jgi:hypothetical protein